jgi:hypothetical protein
MPSEDLQSVIRSVSCALEGVAFTGNYKILITLKSPNIVASLLREMRSDYPKVYFVGAGKTIAMNKTSFDAIQITCSESSCSKLEGIIHAVSFDREDGSEVALPPCGGKYLQHQKVCVQNVVV